MLTGQTSAAPQPCKPPRPQPAVLATLTDLGQEIDRLDDVAAQLLLRLAPLLSATKGEEANGGGRLYMHCEVSEEIIAKAQHIRSIGDRIVSVLDRLEI